MSGERKTTTLDVGTLAKVGAVGAALAYLFVRLARKASGSSESPSSTCSASSPASSLPCAAPQHLASGGTGYVWSEACFFWHQGAVHTGSSLSRINASKGRYIEPFKHWENADTKRRVHSLLNVSGAIKYLTMVTPRLATEDELLLIHAPEYVEKIKEMDRTGGETGDCAPMCIGGWDIARLSAGSVLVAMDAVMQGQVKNVYVLSRPPGHHATRDQGMGFCVFSNVAIGVKYAQKKYGLKRIAIVDFDVHHGQLRPHCSLRVTRRVFLTRL
jgi:hypothetical protein